MCIPKPSVVANRVIGSALTRYPKASAGLAVPTPMSILTYDLMTPRNAGPDVRDESVLFPKQKAKK